MKIQKVSEERDSKIILALDVSSRVKNENDVRELYKRAKSILDETEQFIAGLKVNFQLLLPLGLYGYLQEVLGAAREYGLPTIIDCKINDVEHTNKWAATHFFDAGFDALTANPFTGWDGGLKGVFDEARRRERGVILLVYMSHYGAEENYGREIVLSDGRIKPYYKFFAEKAVEWGADGVVVGATRPNVISEVRILLPKEIPIFSPGVAVQGGEIEAVFKAGTDYAILGRTVCEAKNPRETIKWYVDRVKKIL